jgi:hypothetical protein
VNESDTDALPANRSRGPMLYPPELRARAWIMATYGTPGNFRMAGMPENITAGRRHPAFFDVGQPASCAASHLRVSKA